MNLVIFTQLRSNNSPGCINIIFAESLGISDSDLTRLGEGDGGRKERVLTPGDEFTNEVEDEVSDIYLYISFPFVASKSAKYLAIFSNDAISITFIRSFRKPNEFYLVFL